MAQFFNNNNRLQRAIELSEEQQKIDNDNRKYNNGLQRAIKLSMMPERFNNAKRYNKKINLERILLVDYNILQNIGGEVIQKTNGNGSCLLYAIEQSLPNKYNYRLLKDDPFCDLDYLMKGGRNFFDDLEWAINVREKIVKFLEYNPSEELKMKFLSLYIDFDINDTLNLQKYLDESVMCLLSYMLNKTIVFLNYNKDTGGIDLHFVGKHIYEEEELYNRKPNLNIFSGGTNFLNNTTGWYEKWKQQKQGSQPELLQANSSFGYSFKNDIEESNIEESNYIVILRDGQHFESFKKEEPSKMALFSEEALEIINSLIKTKRIETAFPFQSYMTIDEIIAILISKRRIGGNKKRTIKRKQNRKKTNKKKKKKKRNKSNKKR